MKKLPLLLALITLAGCSADDLAGPDTADIDLALSAQASSRDATLADFTAELFSINGRWQASDRRGNVTFFLRQATTRNPAAIEGKGVIRDSVNRTLTVTIEGHYEGRDIEIALFDLRGETVAKGQGMFSTDRSAFKVLLMYTDDRERTLEFSRR